MPEYKPVAPDIERPRAERPTAAGVTDSEQSRWFERIHARGADEGCCHACAVQYLLQCPNHVLRTFGKLTNELASKEEATRWACPLPSAWQLARGRRLSPRAPPGVRTCTSLGMTFQDTRLRYFHYRVRADVSVGARPVCRAARLSAESVLIASKLPCRRRVTCVVHRLRADSSITSQETTNLLVRDAVLLLHFAPRRV